MNFDEWRETYSAGPLMNEAMARAAWHAAIAAEREACAQLCDIRETTFKGYKTDGLAALCAAAIRARSKT